MTKNQLDKFMKNWVSMLWHAMRATGHGYKRHSLRHSGRGDDRRTDKECGESKVQRLARLNRIGVR